MHAFFDVIQEDSFGACVCDFIDGGKGQGRGKGKMVREGVRYERESQGLCVC